MQINHSRSLFLGILSSISLVTLSACGGLSEKKVKEIHTHIEVMKGKEGHLKTVTIQTLDEIAVAVEQDTTGAGAKELASMQEVANSTKEMLEYVDRLSMELIDISGGYDDENKMIGASDRNAVNVLLLGPNNNGKGYDLKKMMDQFTDKMNSYCEGSSLKFGYINSLPVSWANMGDPATKTESTDFVERQFKNKATAVAVEKLWELKLILLDMESKVLKKHIQMIEKSKEEAQAQLQSEDPSADGMVSEEEILE